MAEIDNGITGPLNLLGSHMSALAYHNAQLEASAFREEYDPEMFEDLTKPKLDMIHKVPYSHPFTFRRG
jgi:hypothetical protein